jgi:hypothetical protein
VREREYILMVSCDVFTSGHTQWYFFSIGNMQPNVQ